MGASFHKMGPFASSLTYDSAVPVYDALSLLGTMAVAMGLVISGPGTSGPVIFESVAFDPAGFFLVAFGSEATDSVVFYLAVTDPVASDPVAYYFAVTFQLAKIDLAVFHLYLVAFELVTPDLVTSDSVTSDSVTSDSVTSGPVPFDPVAFDPEAFDLENKLVFVLFGEMTLENASVGAFWTCASVVSWHHVATAGLDDVADNACWEHFAS